MPLSYMDDVDFYPYVYYQYDSTGNITLALHGIVDNGIIGDGDNWGRACFCTFLKWVLGIIGDVPVFARF